MVDAAARGVANMNFNSNVNASEYRQIMKGLKTDLEKMLEPLDSENEPGKFNVDIEFIRPPNDAELYNGDEGDKVVRVKQIVNPLTHSWPKHFKYTPQGSGRIGVLFLGRNPSTYDLSGIPFPEKEVMKFWDIEVENCESGTRFWHLMKTFVVNDLDNFHKHHFVINCNPLCFVGDVRKVDGTNPPVGNTSVPLGDFDSLDNYHLVKLLMKISDKWLEKAIQIMNPDIIIPIGWYPCKILERLKNISDYRVGDRIPDPSGRRWTYEDEWILEARLILTKQGFHEIL